MPGADACMVDMAHPLEEGVSRTLEFCRCAKMHRRSRCIVEQIVRPARRPSYATRGVVGKGLQHLCVWRRKQKSNPFRQHLELWCLMYPSTDSTLAISRGRHATTKMNDFGHIGMRPQMMVREGKTCAGICIEICVLVTCKKQLAKLWQASGKRNLTNCSNWKPNFATF